MSNSGLMARAGLYSLLGKLFGGNRDLYKVFGYDKAITYDKAVARYRRQDIAARIVEAPADALWSNPPKLTSDNTTWDAAWNDLVTKRNLWSAVNRVDCMAGMGDFAVMLVGFDGTGKLDAPAGKRESRNVLYLQPYSYAATDIKKLVDNTNDERYLRPELYTIKPSMDPMERTNTKPLGSSMKGIASFEVHHSRILHVGEHFLQDEVYGNPRLERVWNLLDDVLKVAGGTAETYWLTANRGMQVDIDKEMSLTPDDENDLNSEIEEYIHQLRRVIRTRGVKITNLGSDVPDPINAFSVILSLISGATGIPKRILLGSEAGQLASDQDRNNWAERIEERRKKFAEPVIIYPLIRLLTAAGALPEANIKLEWPDAFKLTPLERAQTSAQTARSAANLAKAVDTNSDIMSTDEARKVLGLDQHPQNL